MRLTLLIFVIAVQQLHSQVDSTKLYSQNLLQDILEDASIDLEESYLYDQLEALQDHPVNLNTAEINDLMSIPFLDLNSANQIINYREMYGRFYSTSELKLIEGLDDNLAEVLPLFTTIAQPEGERFINLSGLSIELRSRFIKDIQGRRGFKEGIYLGEDLKSYQRIKLNSARFNAAALIEKDSGEKDYNDFSSFSFSINDYSFIDKITLGDYLIEFGQGLIYWGPYSFGKGAEAVRTITRSARTIRDYTSTDENQFFRGGAAQLSFDNFSVTAHYSDHYIDGNVDTATGLISSLPVSGYHRTINEVSRIDVVNEKTLGLISAVTLFNKLNLSVAYQNISYDRRLEVDDIYDPRGSEFNFYSAAYSFVHGNIRLSGEAAYNSISVASVNNFEWVINKNLSLLTSIRNYPRNFYTLHGTGFGESSTTSNEFGIYNGIRWRSNFGIFNFYYDQFRFPSPSFYSDYSSSGDEFLIDYQVRPFSRSLLNIRLKREKKEVTESVDAQDIILNEIKNQIRINYDYNVTRNLRFRTRIDYVFFNQSVVDKSETGYLLFQDIRYDPIESLRLYERIVFFETDSYDSRVYQFENDVRGVLFNPALFGRGTRWYFIVEYEFMEYYRLSFKYSELYKPGEKFIGSGYNEIRGNLDNRITLQLDVNF